MNFYNIVQHAHSGLRWIVLFTLLGAIGMAFAKWQSKEAFGPKPPKLALFALISTHLQFVLGLILYFISPYVRFDSSTMGDKLLRFYTVEHITMMLIAIVLITIGYSRSKRQAPDNGGYRTIFIFFLIGLILILLGIPWPFRELNGAWF